jgi:O-acetyl-ADP-ribose deacetylase (regulator of RNase III)
LAAETAVTAVQDWLHVFPESLDAVLFVCFGPENLELYRELLGS